MHDFDGSFRFRFIRSPGDFWETYDSSEMRLNPDLTENALNRKEVNFKRIRHMDEGEWKSSNMVSEVKAALDFTENSRSGVEFSIPIRTLATKHWEFLSAVI